ncbi:kinase family protein [Lichtheimia corymbifera JMRC:FSU:9682]|uniref:Kinase family protein n=1 Tax=Lichtheimia corymbifera JMRC:FSU:9682 TaxID=1263082 RepID=A0A068RKI8_9FUNG|nr:kinase family protein [Lichtheimia corymbifera JMRC:FSU:9682]
MSQAPAHNSLAFLKGSNASTSSFDRLNTSRSRSGSLMRAMSNHNPTPSTALTRRFSEALPRNSFLHDQHDSTTLNHPLSHYANPSTTSFSQLPDTNWANRLEDFELKDPIGYGSSAVVYGAIYKPLNKRVALKMIDLDMFERNQIDELRRETALMALSKHPNVLQVYGSFVNGSKLYIVTPYLSAGSCLDIIKSAFKQGFEETTIATILKQALEGLVYLHKNGHIHRDVKAGNLLMDEHGTVLLADFGVSSSLTENGGVRKTFVGTPCWMAPEVMEQASYDYKADIWSFGITALELAKGHAPFAKFPPMKVLMMTLSNDPPTLDRDSTKYKYTKVFKEMIDCCLQKDPRKRPTAEKLLQHPFFKQAKKKEYLCKSLLVHVPSLEQRPHKKVPQKHITFETTEQWDFDTDDTTTTTEKKQPTRKHISFGEVVIRDAAKPATATTASDSSNSTITKKSRFVIEENHDTPPVSTPSPPVAPLDVVSPSNPDCEIKKGRFSVNQRAVEEVATQDLTPLPLSRLSSQDSVHGERKSRFEIQQQPHPSTEGALSRENSNSSGVSLPRNGSTSSKSSRFSVEVEQHHPAGRDEQQQSSTTTTTTNDCCRKKGRFELSGNAAATATATNTMDRSADSSLSGSPNTSPYTSLSRDPSSVRHIITTAQSPAAGISEIPSIMYTQMETLFKQNEIQRSLLNDMLSCLSNTTQQQRSRKPSYDGAEHHPSDTVERLQQQLAISHAERDKLSRENEALKRELEQLRRNNAK